MITITDSNKTLTDFWNHFEAVTTKLVRDERDRPFVIQILKTLFTQVPFALYIFLNRDFSWWLAIPYLILLVYNIGPHLLMLHNITHRNPWNKEIRTLMDTFVSMQGLLFGLPPQLYYTHHIKMHHKYSNNKEDLSSTEKYQRDSFFHWLIYFFRFSLFTIVEVPLHFIKRERRDFAIRAFLGQVIFYLVIVAAYLYHDSATVLVFIIPTVFCWFGLMGGNWAQHAFIDQTDPANLYKHSITVINSLYNERCFNDGYHIGHHISPGRHWTDMPRDFKDNLDKYTENDAIVFRSLDYQIIWFLLMMKRYDVLVKYFIPLEGQPKNREEQIEFLKSKVLPVKA